MDNVTIVIFFGMRYDNILFQDFKNYMRLLIKLKHCYIS